MRNIVRIIGVSTALLAGTLLIGGVAWAQATKTPVSGTVESFVVTVPGETRLDDEGVEHVRNERARLRFAGDIVGQMFRIASYNVDTLTREADFHGSFRFRGYVLGGQAVTATGRFATLCSGEPSVCEENSIWQLRDGRKIRLTEVFLLDAAGPDEYEGTVHDPQPLQ